MQPLQQALKSAIAAHDVGKKHNVTLYVQQSDVNLRLSTVESEITRARDDLKIAASDAEVAEAKAALDRAVSERDVCHIRLEGIGEKIIIAEAALAAAERAVAQATSDLAVNIARTACEPRALEIAKELGRLRRRRMLLARIAATSATAASGMASDPLGGTSGDRTAWSIELDDLLTAKHSTETITTDDLLEWPLAHETSEAAE